VDGDDVLAPDTSERLLDAKAGQTRAHLDPTRPQHAIPKRISVQTVRTTSGAESATRDAPLRSAHFNVATPEIRGTFDSIGAALARRVADLSALLLVAPDRGCISILAVASAWSDLERLPPTIR
jgi:hypothetical protein